MSQESYLQQPFSRSTKRLKRIDVISAGSIYGILCALLGLLYVPFGLIFVIAGASSGEMEGVGIGIGIGLVIIILAPILYGLMGFVMGMLMALIYNLAARFTGGLKLEFEDET